MGIVRYALKFPNTFLVLAVIIMLLGGGAALRMPIDIFPTIDIPVVTVIWTYSGLSTKETEQRVTTYSEYTISNNVNDIKNIESQTLQGVSVLKVYFQPGVNIDLALAQIVSSTNSIRALMPPGINPPIVVRYNASSVPVIQLSLSSDNLSESDLFDYGIYRIRQQLTAVPGATLPTPWGGKPRQIMVDLDPERMLATGVTAADVSAAVNAQNLTVPSGQVKVGKMQYVVRTNATPDAVEMLNSIPIKQMNGATIYVRDVANVRDGFAIQQNVVRTEGRRSVLLTVLKNGNASTLDVVNRVKNDVLPASRAAAPPGLKIDSLFDQSVFVSSAVADVVREGVIAAGLTGLMILLFLGSWRSTLIVLISIPLSIMTSLAVLYALGNTINVMTLGGMALAVGVLVDDATVTIENSHRLLGEGRPLFQATLEGAAGIAKPALISTLAICMAFISVIFLDGPARFLFVPQAMAVVFAMLASYVLSRTLVPICINFLLKHEHHGEHAEASTFFGRINGAFNRGFDRLRESYTRLLTNLLHHRWRVAAVAGVVAVTAAAIYPFIGEDYFPTVDAGLIQLHVRARPGLRIENTEQVFQAVEEVIRDVIPERDRGLILDNIGLPAINYNLAFGDGSTVGLNDGQILISLKEGHEPTAHYIKKLRVALRGAFPDTMFYFQAADIVTQILNFGLPAPIDIQVLGRDGKKNLAAAREIEARLRNIRGAADVHLHQMVDAPEFYVDVDRVRAAQLGLTEQAVANNVTVNLSSSYQVAPNFWTDPRSGIPYPVAVQTPEYRLDSLNKLQNTALINASTASDSGDAVPNLLGNVATLRRGIEQTVANHSNVAPVYDIYANVQDRDLGGVATEIKAVVDDVQKQLSPGNRIVVRGQIDSMNQAFGRLTIGLLAAAVFVYLLMVVNFQTWIDPFIVICALPGAMCGIVISLFVTGTTFSIPSLMGAVMSVGVASANSILLVTFASEMQQHGKSALAAAIEAGRTRLRPILMTAAAMIVGMIPMALGLGDGSEQNAALARAVIGGLLFGTCSTLFIVPLLYSLFRRNAKFAPAEVEG